MMHITGWLLFHGIVFSILAFDLGILNKRARVIPLKEALSWVGVWFTLAMLFNGYIYFSQGIEKSTEFLTIYIIEASLSIDNIFVFLMFFKQFHIPENLRHRVLFWGILGAIVLRGLFILAGIELIEKFEWLNYIFGLVLMYGSYRMLVSKPAETVPNKWLKVFKKIIPVTKEFYQQRFFIKKNKRWMATPLFLCLISIEFADVIFAFDSIPAALAISQDKFIVYTANIFSILGLRSLYFAVSHFVSAFVYLKYSLSVILFFVGIKILISSFYEIPSFISLIVIATIAGLGFLKKEQN
jgi:tellurite resistance protein TerC